MSVSCCNTSLILGKQIDGRMVLTIIEQVINGFTLYLTSLKLKSLSLPVLSFSRRQLSAIRVRYSRKGEKNVDSGQESRGTSDPVANYVTGSDLSCTSSFFQIMKVEYLHTPLHVFFGPTILPETPNN